MGGGERVRSTRDTRHVVCSIICDRKTRQLGCLPDEYLSLRRVSSEDTAIDVRIGDRQPYCTDEQENRDRLEHEMGVQQGPVQEQDVPEGSYACRQGPRPIALATNRRIVARSRPNNNG